MTYAERARIINATVFRIIERHLLVRPRKPVNDNEQGVTP